MLKLYKKIKIYNIFKFQIKFKMIIIFIFKNYRKIFIIIKMTYKSIRIFKIKYKNQFRIKLNKMIINFYIIKKIYFN